MCDRILPTKELTVGQTQTDYATLQCTIMLYLANIRTQFPPNVCKPLGRLGGDGAAGEAYRDLNYKT